MKKLVLIDGQSLLYKMYCGMPESTDLENANTCFCFLHSFLRFLESEPSHLMVFLGEEQDDMPVGLKKQLGVVKKYLKELGIYTVETNHVRQDILGFLSHIDQTEEVLVVTSDCILQQCVSEQIKLLFFSIKDKEEQWKSIDNEYIKEAYGICASFLPDVYALAGNREEKRMGANAIGLQTACELIRNYGSLEGLFENIEKIDCEWIRTSLIQCETIVKEDRAYFVQATDNVDLVTDELTVLDELESKIKDILQVLGIKDIKEKKAKKKTITVLPQLVTVNSKNDMNAIFEECRGSKKCAFRLLRQKNDAGQMGSFENGQMFLQLEEPKAVFVLFLTLDGKKTYIISENSDITVGDIAKGIKDIIGTNQIDVSCFNEKDNYDVLFHEEASEKLSAKNIVNGLFDCNIGAYLLNPLKSEYTVSDLAKEYMDVTLPKWNDIFGKTDLATSFSTRKQECIDFFANETVALWFLFDILKEQLKETKMDTLMKDLEMPLSYVLYDMEQEGILVKPDELKAYGDTLEVRIKELEKIIYAEAKEEFNINSPKQLGEILFEKMMLPGGKKTKTGYSTAADVLEKLAPEYPFVKNILEYRQLTKLKSTYAEGLAAFIGEDKRIHTHFNQTITATGRLSSTEPNLQNIPMRMELGRRIRKVFIPADGCVFMDADYSQIELRVLAHMSNDRQLIEAYQMDEDIHRITASKVFHTPFEEVTDLQRRNAKAVNFGIVYGISSFGLSQDLSISTKEAKSYIDEYFKTYPGIKDFLNKTVEQTKQFGYCLSMFGRRRPVPELKSSNHMQRAFGERIAMNSPIQGTAADLIKFAMLHVYDALKKEGLKSKLILQIHDELLIETREDEIEQVKEILTREMKNVCDMAVKLEIDLHTGNDWYEAK